MRQRFVLELPACRTKQEFNILPVLLTILGNDYFTRAGHLTEITRIKSTNISLVITIPGSDHISYIKKKTQCDGVHDAHSVLINASHSSNFLSGLV